MKSFERPKSKRVTHCSNHNLSNDTWTIKHLVDETIYPATQCIISDIYTQPDGFSLPFIT